MNSNSLTVVRTLKPVAIVFLWLIILLSIGGIIQFGLLARPAMVWVVRGLLLPDLLLHIIAFASLAMPAFLLFRPMMKTALGIFVMGAGLELAQWVTQLGEASVIDLAANAAGIGLAALVIGLLKRCDFSILRPLLGRAA